MIGIDEITWSHGWRVTDPSAAVASTSTARPSSWRTRVTLGLHVHRRALRHDLVAADLPHHPGPCFGYWNSSIREVMSFWFRFGRSMLTIALPRSRSLIRCAAQSAGIDETGTPHTFSV